MNLITEEILKEIQSCWILPDGEIQHVPNEKHDRYLPDQYETVEVAEKMCVRVSCGWGWNAQISEIYLPERITGSQASVLVMLDEKVRIKKMIERCTWRNDYSWDEILDAV